MYASLNRQDCTLKSRLDRQQHGILWKHFPNDHIARQLVQTQLNLILPSVNGYCLTTLGELADDFTFEMASVVNVLRLNASYSNSAWIDPSNLPLPSDDIDAIFLPFQLEQADDPHALLRESYRALRPGGKLILCTLNPYSLWGIRRLMNPFDKNPLWQIPYYSHRRLLDWLSILDFDVKVSHSFMNPLWLKKYQQGDTLISSASYSVFGCINFIVADKRVVPLTLKPQWRDIKSRGAVGIEGLRRTMLQEPYELGKRHE